MLPVLPINNTASDLWVTVFEGGEEKLAGKEANLSASDFVSCDHLVQLLTTDASACLKQAGACCKPFLRGENPKNFGLVCHVSLTLL